MNLERYPLDFEVLRRGDFLSPEDVERATNTLRSVPDYWRKQLKLRDMIQEWFRDNRGDVVTVTCEQDGLRLLTHEEQSAYASRRGSRAVGQIMVAAVELSAVDVTQLSENTQATHARRNYLASFRAQQLMKPPPPRLEG